MSFLTLAKYLQDEVANSAEEKKALEQLIVEIERNEKLKYDEKVSREQLYQMQIEVSTLTTLQEQILGERKQFTALRELISTAHQCSNELQVTLHKCDIQKKLDYDLLVNEVQRQQESEQLEQQERQRMEMRQKMEQREIVKQLRAKQTQLRECEAKHREAEEFMQSSRREDQCQLRKVTQQRNEMIVTLVTDAKELRDNLQQLAELRDAEQKREKLLAERTQLLSALEQQTKESSIPDSRGKCAKPQANPTSCRQLQVVAPYSATLEANDSGNLLAPSTSASAQAPYDPMAFLKSLNLEISIDQAMQTFMAELQAKNAAKQMPKLRSILRHSAEDAGGAAPVTIKSRETRHVHFEESISSATSSPSSSCHSSELLDSPNTEQELPAGSTATSDVASTTFQSLLDDSESSVDLLTPTTAVETQESLDSFASSSNSAADEKHKTTTTTTKKQPLEIQQCKIIKPAGTSLPRYIPFNLSPTEVAKTPTNSASNVEPNDDQIFKKPKPTTKTTQMKISPASILNELTFDSGELHSTTSTGPKSKRAGRHKDIHKYDSFESFYMVNQTPSDDSNHSDDDGDENNAPGNTNDSEMFDFSLGQSVDANDEDIEFLDFSDMAPQVDNDDYL